MKQKKFPTKLFVAISFINLFLFFLILLFLKQLFFGDFFISDIQEKKEKSSQYYFKDFENPDPFLMINPSLKNILAGPIINNYDPSLGDDGAKINLVLYSDFLCSFCHNQEKVLKNILAKYGRHVKLIWKDFPEINRSSMSWQASIAARCALEQGKFWEYHDLLFANNENLSPAVFLDLAKDLDLRSDIFAECLQDEKIADLVIDNIIEAEALGINGIPYIFVNDQEFMAELSEFELEKIIEIELNKISY